MSFVLVNADFSDCKPQEKAAIYDHLAAMQWIKMSEDASDIKTVWLAPLTPGLSQDDAVTVTKNNFYSCCTPRCKAKAAFQLDYNDAGLVNLLIGY